MQEPIPEVAQRRGSTISHTCTCASLPALAYVGLGGVGSFVVAVCLLHWLQPDLAPLDEAVSYYVHGTHGWLLTAGLLGLGFGSLALTAGSANTTGTGSRVGRWFLTVWSAGAILGGIFPADPAGTWDQPPSLAGIIHGNAALVAFVAFPVAANHLSRNFRRDSRSVPFAGVLQVLAWASAVSLFAFMGSLTPVLVSPGPPILLGLAERILLAVYVAWLVVVAVALLRRKSEHRQIDSSTVYL